MAHQGLKPSAYRPLETSCLPGSRRWQSAISLLSKLGVEAETARRRVIKSGIVAAAIPELRVGLHHGTYHMHSSSLGLRACATERGFHLGADCPTDDVM
jgi:hypothetical protein